MRKEITHSLFVEIDGVDVPWESLSEAEKDEIPQKINDKALRSIGYVPVKNKEIA